MTSGNPILDKNLDCIGKYSPELKEKLLNIKNLISSYEVTETSLKEPNLLYNGIPLHSPDGAEKEAHDIFTQVENSPTAVHIVFGMGLGYLFKECCENSKGFVFLYEPNIEMLRVTLEIVDFSEELSKDKVFVFSDMKFLKSVFEHVYMYEAKTSFLTLPSYQQVIYRHKIKEIISDMEIMELTCWDAYLISANVEEASIETVLYNFPRLLKSTPIKDLSNMYEGKTALIVCAGPTLAKNLETIKQNRDKFILFCVGTSLKTILNYGIDPDYVGIVEFKDVSKQLEGVDLSKVDLITEPYTHRNTVSYDVNERFLYIPEISYANSFFSELTDVNLEGYYCKGTVSYLVSASAKMMGFKKLIFVGQDLAYINNQRYSSVPNALEKGSACEKTEDGQKPEEKFVKTVSKKRDDSDMMREVKGITGEMLTTQAGYATFISAFEEFADSNKDLDLINTSMVGALIKGFKNIPLEEALKGLPKVKKITNFKKHVYDVPKIVETLHNTRLKLNKSLKCFKEGQSYVEKYEREYKRNKISKDLIKYLKKLLTIYEKVGNENNYNVYQALSFAEEGKLKYVLKEYQDYTPDEIVKTFEALKDYFIKVEKRILNISAKIEELENNLSVEE